MHSEAMQWYVLTIQSRTPRLTAQILRGKGFEEYLPLYCARRRWSDRTKTIEVPLFPGYLFCRFDPLDRMVPVLTTPGVTGVVSAGRTPIPVSERELDAVRAVLASGLAAQAWPYLGVGSKVSIAAGPLELNVATVSSARSTVPI